MAVTKAEELAEVGAVVAVVAGGWAALARAGASQRRHEWIARRRAREATRAAVVAAGGRESFDPAHITGAVVAMLDDAALTWRGPAEESRADPAGVLGRWAREHDAGPGSELRGARAVDLLRVVNREDESEDRVVVRVRVSIRRGRVSGPLDPRVLHVDERWTLARDGSRWRLVEFDAQPLADELLRAPQIPSGDTDDARLAESSLEDLAEDASSPASVAGLADADASPRAQLLDLFLLDERFAPDFIAATLRGVVEAWEESTTGSETPLRARATEAAAQQLLAPETGWASARLILRDATLTGWKPLAVDTADPPRVTLTATVTAVRYLIDGATGAALAGARDIRRARSGVDDPTDRPPPVLAAGRHDESGRRDTRREPVADHRTGPGDRRLGPADRRRRVG